MKIKQSIFYNNGSIEKIKGQSNLINYLGFTFDGKTVRIRVYLSFIVEHIEKLKK